MEETKKKPWRKAHMIDLNTLDTKEKWLRKLERLSPESKRAMRQALRDLRMMPS
jgi:hypothetical protein